jgi:hypothetical protein
MAFPQEEVDELKQSFTQLSVVTEGGTEFIVIPSLALPEGCEPREADALFCPTPRDGYVSRLFLSTKVIHKGPGQNWNANGVRICNRAWWAVSWNTIQPNAQPQPPQRLAAILAQQLDAFRCKRN